MKMKREYHTIEIFERRKFNTFRRSTSCIRDIICVRPVDTCILELVKHAYTKYRNI